jgi:hypothetical protein
VNKEVVMKKTEQSSGSARNMLLAFALGGITAFAVMNRPAVSRAAERVEPTPSVASSAAGARDVRAVSVDADKDVCEAQLD